MADKEVQNEIQGTIKFCTHCGQKIQPGMKFCGSCGVAVEQTETVEMRENSGDAEYLQKEITKYEQMKKKNGILAAIMGICGIILCAWVGGSIHEVQVVGILGIIVGVFDLFMYFYYQHKVEQKSSELNEIKSKQNLDRKV